MATSIEKVDFETAAIKTLSDSWFGLLGAETAAAAALLKEIGLTTSDKSIKGVRDI